MIFLNIFDVKETMTQLLLRESFDGYLLDEASVTTFAAMKLSGRRNTAWYDEKEELRELPDHLYWREVRGMIFSYIKGRKPPSTFVITLKLTAAEVYRLMPQEALGRLLQEQSAEVLLQFRFDKGRLFVATGMTSTVFTLDKTVSVTWDNVVREIFKGLHIGYEETV